MVEVVGGQHVGGGGGGGGRARSVSRRKSEKRTEIYQERTGAPHAHALTQTRGKSC